ncbi:hypothetical protein [Kaarinaea lacus]
MSMKLKKISLTMRLILVVKMFLIFTSASIADEVSKDYWVDTMKTALPTAFCQSMHFFRQCFDVNEDQCIETASLATKICIHKYITQIPDTLNQPKDGAKWSNIIGQCVGENYFATLSRIYKESQECDEMNFWK